MVRKNFTSGSRSISVFQLSTIANFNPTDKFVKMIMQTIGFLLFIKAAHSRKVHHCVHDKIEHEDLKIASNIRYKDETVDLQDPTRRRLSSTHETIRITPYWDEVESQLTGDDLDYVKSIVSTSIRHFESFTKVRPIDGRLYYPRRCNSSQIPNNRGFKNCFEYIPATCGPSMLHLT